MMAQRIQTVCDVHLARGEDVEGTTWEVLARKAGARTQTREVDLCDECAAVLTSVAAFAAENGRIQQSTPTRARAAAVTPAPSSMPPAAVGNAAMASCTVEGCGSVVTAQNLSRHMRTVHGLEAVASTAAAVHPCPDCERVFTRPQGLGAHRYRAHGYESPTRGERAAAAERAEERAAS